MKFRNPLKSKLTKSLIEDETSDHFNFHTSEKEMDLNNDPNENEINKSSDIV